MKQIGLTGNSGSGKSSAAEMLLGLGACVIDCDEIAHQVIEPGEPAYEELLDYFGEGILQEPSSISDGNAAQGMINRKVLGALAFADQNKLQRLTEITHKYIRIRMEERIRAIKAQPEGCCCIVLDAPLLIEAGLHKEVDSVWVIAAPRNLCISRIMEREGISREAAVNRLDRQLTPAQYAACADVILVNDGDWESLYKQVQIHLTKVVGKC